MEKRPFFHVTDKRNVDAILEEGFEGNWGDAGFGVYLFSDRTAAEDYRLSGGWDGTASPDDMIILRVSCDPFDVAPVTPNPHWPDPESYAFVVFRETSEDAPFWTPETEIETGPGPSFG